MSESRAEVSAALVDRHSPTVVRALLEDASPVTRII
jgi:hypothetical protein